MRMRTAWRWGVLMCLIVDQVPSEVAVAADTSCCLVASAGGATCAVNLVQSQAAVRLRCPEALAGW